MFGPSLTGRTLIWHRVSVPPGGWAYTLNEELVADVAWSGDERAYRIEVADEVWRVAFSRGPLLRGMLTTPGDSVQLVCAGSVGRGLIRTREGEGFSWYSQVSLREGPWSGIDDARGVGVCRTRGRMRRGFWYEVSVTPDPAYERVVLPLLLVWGVLHVHGRRRPWLRLATAFTSERTLRRVLEDLATTLTF